MKGVSRVTTVENGKEQNLVISLEIEDGFIRLITLLKSKLRSFIK